MADGSDLMQRQRLLGLPKHGSLATTADPVATLQQAYDLVESVRSLEQVLTLKHGVRLSVDVERVPEQAEELREVGRVLMAHTGRLAVAAEDLDRTAQQRLPAGFRGWTYVAADARIHSLGKSLSGTVTVLNNAVEVLNVLARSRQSHERLDRTYANEISRLRDPIDAVAAVYATDPTIPWLPQRLAEYRDAAAFAIAQRFEAHNLMRESTAEAVKALNELTGQARLARLARVFLPIPDRVALVAATTHADAPILTAADADSFVDRFQDMHAVQHSELQQLLRDAKSPEEQAYLMKALAVGYSMPEIVEFGAKIHPYGNDIKALDETAATLLGR